MIRNFWKFKRFFFMATYPHFSLISIDIGNMIQDTVEISNSDINRFWLISEMMFARIVILGRLCMNGKKIILPDRARYI